jgi:lysozyme
MPSPFALSLIRKFEGLRLKAYADAGGKWTIGYGSCTGVTDTMEITKEGAEARLLADATRTEEAILRLVSVQLNENELAALVSLVYNIGVGAFSRSTLRRRIIDGDKERSSDEFLRWAYVGKQLLPGLLKRRREEREVFCGRSTRS